MNIEKVFETDQMTKKERVLATLNHQPVDRVALHEQLSFNPGVIAMYTGKHIEGFSYTLDDICEVIRKTMDTCFPPVAPRGTARHTTSDGFVYQDDNWTTWRVAKPFDDEAGAFAYLRKMIERIRTDGESFDPAKQREMYRTRMLELQAKVGETIIIDYPVNTGLCTVYDTLGLELFSYIYADEPDLVSEFIALNTRNGIERIHAVADSSLSPVILIADDFATKQGPLFSPDFLHKNLFPHLKQLVAAWHEHGIKALFHSDGNWQKAIPDLIATGVDGFYCLEPSVGMDIVEFKNTWPEVVWAGGVDGVDLMERGTPEAVHAEVHRHIRETNALETGGMFVASSSEINPPIKPENFRAMVDAVGEMLNLAFKQCRIKAGNGFKDRIPL